MPRTVWLTGLPSSGKTTIAFGCWKALQLQGIPVIFLDGDLVRRGLSSDLGFSDADRTENIRRVAEVAKIMNSQHLDVIAAFVSPLISHRDLVANTIGDGFREVFVECPLEVCESRDPKGLYQKARRGELHNLTGLDGVYEPPLDPVLTVNTSVLDIQASITSVLTLFHR